MKAFQSLPEGYKEILQVNMQEDKNTAGKISAVGIIMMAVVIFIGHFIVPIRKFFDMSSMSGFFIRLGVLIISYIAYMVLHELTHGVVMKAVGGRKVEFGFTGMYAFAGSHEDYFDKSSYRCIALAPLVVWGIIFGILSAIVPVSWFWVIWFLQVGNIGGAAGDVYITAKLWNMPSTIFVRDTGVDMTIFDSNA